MSAAALTRRPAREMVSRLTLPVLLLLPAAVIIGGPVGDGGNEYVSGEALMDALLGPVAAAR
jgi:hypothetical protein